MTKIIGYDVDDLLDLMGLQRQRTSLEAMVPALGLLLAGAAIGAGIGLALAPTSGRRLLKDVGDKLDQIRDRVKSDPLRSNAVNAVSQHS